jgi:ribonuclease R
MYSMQKKSQKSSPHKGEKTSYLEGTISITPKGVGYVTAPDIEEDIEIEPQFLNTALHRDSVRILLHPQIPNERQRGEVTEILVRNKMEYVGVLERNGGFFFLVPQDPRMYVDIIIPFAQAGEAEAGQKVLAAITKWDDPKKNPEGKIIKIIGRPGDHNVEMQAIVLDRGLRPDFPAKVLEEADNIKKNEQTIAAKGFEKRRDARDIITFTIDPADAKDFDDALSVRELPGDLIEIGVHIADVSHYVTPGTELDKEAARRANSIYLVDRTIPMLPEVLSNDLCSLNPHEDKLTFSAIFTFKKEALTGGKHPHVQSQWFGKTVINSNKRFTYEEAQKVLDDKNGLFYNELLILNTLAKKLRKEREERGALSFEHEEVRFELDDDGKPIRVYKKIIQDTNKLVEEFMLLANKKVAHHVHELGKKENKLFVYRVHDEPDQERIRDLVEFLNKLGYNIRIDKNKTISSQELNKILRMAEGKAEQDMIQTAAIRSMAKAVYSTKNIGHYGLAFEHYTHFTSPIRRYADLMVHRLLEIYLAGKHASPEDIHRYAALSNYSSQMEQLAMEAERASIKYKQVEYMAERVGKVFDGVISGVTEWGVYVEEKETKSEGMVRMRDLGDDFYIFDKKHYQIVGERKKKRFRLGDKVRVKVKRANMDQRQIDYEFV